MYEYKVVSAPRASKHFRLFKKHAKIEQGFGELLNGLAAENWEFQSTERPVSLNRELMIFRRRVPKLDDENQRDVAQALGHDLPKKVVVPRRPRAASLPEAAGAVFRSRQLPVRSDRPRKREVANSPSEPATKPA